MNESESEGDLHKAGSDEANIEDWLRQVGARAEPSLDLMREMRQAVYAEWQITVQERRRRRRRVTWGMAASVAIAVSIAILSVRWMLSEPALVATIVRIDGHLLSATAKDAWRPRAVGQRIFEGEILQADDRSRAVVSFDTGISLRLDHGTILKVASRDRVTLSSGALYVDSPSKIASSAAFAVQTQAGSVRHIGTQYEVRTHAEAIEVGVREGRVIISHEAGESTAAAGERVRLTPSGEIMRTTLPRWHADWQWAVAATPAIDIDDRPLSSFLTWVARETGRQLVYTSAEAEGAARQVKLRGSIVGLHPDTALTAVLATTQLQRSQTPDGVIGITLAEEKDDI